MSFSELSYERLRTLPSLPWVVVGFVGTVGLLDVFGVASGVFFSATIAAESSLATGLLGSMVEQTNGIAYLLASWIHIAAGIPFFMWFHGAIREAQERGRTTSWTPWGGVASFFIPVLSLYMPYQLMSELHAVSGELEYDSRGSRWIGLWWVTYLCAGLGDRFRVFVWRDELEPGDLFAYNVAFAIVVALEAIAAFSCCVVVLTIAQRQAQWRNPKSLAAVFG